ncbi:MAG: hypothetical protein WCS65_17200 [Verrucomicrobiae bacterium]
MELIRHEPEQCVEEAAKQVRMLAEDLRESQVVFGIHVAHRLPM